MGLVVAEPLVASEQEIADGGRHRYHALVSSLFHSCCQVDRGAADVDAATTCRQLGLTPDSPGVEDDYHRVNDLLAAVQEDVRRSFLDGIALTVDEQYAGPVANLVSGWSIVRARDAAWTNARVLWSLEGVEPLRTNFLATLSRTVGMAGRYLLTPVADLAS